ncbi:MAG: ATP synthase F1 subunit epsilon [Thermoanaerobaculia bacterium]|nr:ATP synthase F1 subunit epsilon [Thermoanaerobaculia bacterium]
MTGRETFHVSVVTPEQAVLETDAVFASFPAHDGEYGVMQGRAPLLCQLGIGVLRVDDGEKQNYLFIDQGFAQMVDNKLTILTEQARKPSEIERAEVEEALRHAQEEPLQGAEHMWADERLVKIRRAKIQLKVTEMDID